MIRTKFSPAVRAVLLGGPKRRSVGTASRITFWFGAQWVAKPVIVKATVGEMPVSGETPTIKNGQWVERKACLKKTRWGCGWQHGGGGGYGGGCCAAGAFIIGPRLWPHQLSSGSAQTLDRASCRVSCRTPCTRHELHQTLLWQVTFNGESKLCSLAGEEALLPAYLCW